MDRRGRWTSKGEAAVKRRVDTLIAAGFWEIKRRGDKGQTLGKYGGALFGGRPQYAEAGQASAEGKGGVLARDAYGTLRSDAPGEGRGGLFARDAYGTLRSGTQTVWPPARRSTATGRP